MNTINTLKTIKMTNTMKIIIVLQDQINLIWILLKEKVSIAFHKNRSQTLNTHITTLAVQVIQILTIIKIKKINKLYLITTLLNF